MKKIILGITILAVAAAGVQTAKAGDREWAVAGKVLTGLVIASAINHAIADDHCHSTVYYQAPAPVVYCPPPPRVVYAPAYCPPAPRIVYAPAYCPPPVVYRAPACYEPAPVVVVRPGHRHHRW
ncbi:MAG: hypothetical protein U1F65_02500 [Verrucomicrobiota bacterium]